MSEFDNWKEEQERIHNDYDAENAWYAGQQSQQTKIDELNEVVNGWKDEYRIMTLRYERSKKQIDELQKQVITQGQNFNDQAQKLKDAEYFNQQLGDRIDEVVEYLEGSGGVNLTSKIALNYILKGNKDEN